MIAQYQLTSVQKCYGEKIVLELEELTIWPGHLYILMGPNGSGKSTLLSMLAFLTKPDGGQISFAGDRVIWKTSELKPLRKKITLLHQFPYLFAGTVFSNVAFGLKIRGINGRTQRRTIADALALVGLAGFEDRQIRTLSGGEYRRVALSRTLALSPDVLLLDEPLANVDEQSARVIEPLIASLPRRGMTVVMSTHDMQHSDRMEGDVIHLLNGRLAKNASGQGREWYGRNQF